jgi:hypothetical protein
MPERIVDHSTSAAPRPTSLLAPVNVKISVRVAYEIILRTESSAAPGLAETEFTQARTNQREAMMMQGLDFLQRVF